MAKALTSEAREKHGPLRVLTHAKMDEIVLCNVHKVVVHAK